MNSEERWKKGIAELYNESSGFWEDLWGDHMHATLITTTITTIIARFHFLLTIGPLRSIWLKRLSNLKAFTTTQ